MINANSITIDLAWYKILSEFSETLRRRVFDAILTFAATGQKPAFRGQAKLAFELIAHEVSKQITASQSSKPSELSESSESSETSETSETSEKSDSSEEAIIEQYYSQYPVPEPFTYTESNEPREVTAERIRILVGMNVRCMLEKGEIKPHDPDFFFHLDKYVNLSYQTLCMYVSRLAKHEYLDDERWSKLLDLAHWQNLP